MDILSTKSKKRDTKEESIRKHTIWNAVLCFVWLCAQITAH